MTMRVGSRVSWQTSQGKTSGKTVEKKTADFTFEGQRFTPADDDPYWIVESKTGRRAAHRQSALTHEKT